MTREKNQKKYEKGRNFCKNGPQLKDMMQEGMLVISDRYIWSGPLGSLEFDFVKLPFGERARNFAKGF